MRDYPERIKLSCMDDCPAKGICGETKPKSRAKVADEIAKLRLLSELKTKEQIAKIMEDGETTASDQVLQYVFTSLPFAGQYADHLETQLDSADEQIVRINELGAWHTLARRGCKGPQLKVVKPVDEAEPARQMVYKKVCSNASTRNAVEKYQAAKPPEHGIDQMALSGLSYMMAMQYLAEANEISRRRPTKG